MTQPATSILEDWPVLFWEREGGEGRAGGETTRSIVSPFVSLVAASVLASGLVLASVLMARPADAAPTCGPTWSTVPSAAGFGDPRAIAPVAGNDIWIVGSRSVGSVPNATGAGHWDGNSWTLVSTPMSRSGQTFSQRAFNGADAPE